MKALTHCDGEVQNIIGHLSILHPSRCRQEATHADTQHRRCCEREAGLQRALAEREAEVEHLTEITARGESTVRGALSRLKVGCVPRQRSQALHSILPLSQVCGQQSA